ncbi:MAG: hypothetical protein F6J95_026345 [Leptolyngbya sp. SIO1E4]|nr:hypothetical protein [Leptolyngbya sp. SIO1E4]
MKLGQILVQQGAISVSELEETLHLQAQQIKPLGRLFVREGYITTAQLDTALQEQYWRNHGYWVIN